jgi:protein-S-isoprenylcysteine O-methyltransferase Ste14
VRKGDARLEAVNRRLDLGRLLMVPAAAAIMFFDVIALIRQSYAGQDGALRLVGSVLVITFYAFVIGCYLLRGPAVATSRSFTAHAAALVATWLPFALPFLRGTPPGRVGQVTSSVLVVVGLACSVWALRALGRNVSVLAQAREVSKAGPYRLVRHPLYTGELISSLGIVIAMHTLAAAGCWLALCALQVYRAMAEEEVLAETLPAYREYRGRTAALLPGLSLRRLTSGRAGALGGVEHLGDPADHLGDQRLRRGEVEPERAGSALAEGGSVHHGDLGPIGDQGAW